MGEGGCRCCCWLWAPAYLLPQGRWLCGAPPPAPPSLVSPPHFPVLGESSSGISRDDYISQVAKDIENKMPKVFDLDQVRKHLGLGLSPTSVVLLQELARFNKLVVRMGRSLAELQRVSTGPGPTVCAGSARLGRLMALVLRLGLGWGGRHEQRAGRRGQVSLPWADP